MSALRLTARRLPAAGVGALCLLIVAVVDLALAHEHGLSGDEPFYARMATHPGGAHTFPYAYRVVLPWLVHVLPVSQTTAFRGLAWLGCLFIVRRSRLALAATLFVAVGIKETTVLLVPLAYAVWAARPFDRAALRDTGLVALAPLAALLLLRAGVTAIGSGYTPEYAGSFLHARWAVLREALSGIELRRLAYTFGPLWVAAAFALRSERFARRAALVLMLTLLLMDAGYAVYMEAYGIQHGLDRGTTRLRVR